MVALSSPPRPTAAALSVAAFLWEDSRRAGRDTLEFVASSPQAAAARTGDLHGDVGGVALEAVNCNEQAAVILDKGILDNTRLQPRPTPRNRLCADAAVERGASFSLPAAVTPRSPKGLQLLQLEKLMPAGQRAQRQYKMVVEPYGAAQRCNAASRPASSMGNGSFRGPPVFSHPASPCADGSALAARMTAVASCSPEVPASPGTDLPRWQHLKKEDAHDTDTVNWRKVAPSNQRNHDSMSHPRWQHPPRAASAMAKLAVATVSPALAQPRVQAVHRPVISPTAGQTLNFQDEDSTTECPLHSAVEISLARNSSRASPASRCGSGATSPPSRSSITQTGQDLFPHTWPKRGSAGSATMQSRVASVRDSLAGGLSTPKLRKALTLGAPERSKVQLEPRRRSDEWCAPSEFVAISSGGKRESMDSHRSSDATIDGDVLHFEYTGKYRGKKTLGLRKARAKILVRELCHDLSESMNDLPEDIWDACGLRHPSSDDTLKSNTLQTEVDLLPEFKREKSKDASRRNSKKDLQPASTGVEEERSFIALAKQSGWCVLDIEEVHEIFIKHAVDGFVGLRGVLFERVIDELFMGNSHVDREAVVRHIVVRRRRHRVAQDSQERQEVRFAEFFRGLSRWLTETKSGRCPQLFRCTLTFCQRAAAEHKRQKALARERRNTRRMTSSGRKSKQLSAKSKGTHNARQAPLKPVAVPSGIAVMRTKSDGGARTLVARSTLTGAALPFIPTLSERVPADVLPAKSRPGTPPPLTLGTTQTLEENTERRKSIKHTRASFQKGWKKMKTEPVTLQEFSDAVSRQESVEIDDGSDSNNLSNIGSPRSELAPIKLDEDSEANIFTIGANLKFQPDHVYEATDGGLEDGRSSGHSGEDGHSSPRRSSLGSEVWGGTESDSDSSDSEGSESESFGEEECEEEWGEGDESEVFSETEAQ